jgi:uncharacterized repeat protein (TIGR02543 family)
MIKNILLLILLSFTLLNLSACGGNSSSAGTPATNYSVTFTSNGGSAVCSQLVTYNTPATAPTAPIKTGDTFAGWYSDAALTTPFVFTTAITGDITLYAKWTPIPPIVYTTATLKINLNGDLGGKAIAGAGFTLTLPANVTPATVNGAVATSVVTSSGTFAGSTIAPIVTYIPATGTTPGTLQIIVSNSVDAGVTTAGEVATVALQLINGAAPVAANFTLNSVPVTVIDTLGNSVAGMTASVAGVTLQ